MISSLPAGTMALLWRVVLWAVLPALLALAAGLLLARAVAQPFAVLVRDPSVTSGEAVYLGALSALTVMVWTAGAAVALAVGVPDARRQAVPRLLVMLGLLGAAFAVDDQFQVHDGLVQRVRIGEEVVLAVYALWIVLTVVSQRQVLRGRPETAVLVLAGLLLGISVAVDLAADRLAIVQQLSEQTRLLVEDGAKLVGAAVYSAGLIALARRGDRTTAGR